MNPQVDRCWFCGSPTRRDLRPPRICPFCRERVRPRAVKCPHCNEFLDGRDRPSGGGGGTTTIIVQGMPGAPPAGPARPVLAAPTRVSAVAPPAPGPAAGRLALDAPAVPANSGRLLPAPSTAPDATVEIVDDDDPLPNVGESRFGKLGDGDSVVDVEAASVPALRSKGGVAGGAGLPATRDGSAGAAGNGGGAGLPALRSDAPLSLPERIADSALPAVIDMGKRLFAAIFPPKLAVDSDATTVQAIDPEAAFRICENCASEILAVDNFCFHCGTQHRQNPFPKTAPARAKSNAWVHTLVMTGLVVLAVGDLFMNLAGVDPALATPVRLGGGGVATALACWAFARKPGFLARLWSFLFVLVCLAALVIFVPDVLGGD